MSSPFLSICLIYLGFLQFVPQSVFNAVFAGQVGAGHPNSPYPPVRHVINVMPGRHDMTILADW
jgi:hypothetical protein